MIRRGACHPIRSQWKSPRCPDREGQWRGQIRRRRRGWMLDLALRHRRALTLLPDRSWLHSSRLVWARPWALAKLRTFRRAGRPTSVGCTRRLGRQRRPVQRGDVSEARGDARRRSKTADAARAGVGCWGCWGLLGADGGAAPRRPGLERAVRQPAGDSWNCATPLRALAACQAFSKKLGSVLSRSRTRSCSSRTVPCQATAHLSQTALSCFLRLRVVMAFPERGNCHARVLRTSASGALKYVMSPPLRARITNEAT